MTFNPVNPWTMPDEERQALLKQAKRGELLELQARARVYRDTHNKNNWRLAPDLLESRVARASARAVSGKEPPQVLLDHGDSGLCAPKSVRKKIGYWVDAEVRADEDGVAAVEIDYVLVDPIAQQDYLRRKLDRFSVGLSYPTRAWCSLCHAPSDGHWSELSCAHVPGELDEEMGKVAEVFVDSEFDETSFVLNPAVAGTAVLGTEAGPQFSEWRLAPGGRPQGDEPRVLRIAQEDKKMDKEIEVQAAAPEPQANPELEKALARVKALELQAFDEAFGAAVREGRVLPAARASLLPLFETGGLEAAKALLVSLPAHGLDRPAAQSQAEVDGPPKAPELPLQAASVLAQFGYIQSEMCSEAGLRKINFFNRRRGQ